MRYLSFYQEGERRVRQRKERNDAGPENCAVLALMQGLNRAKCWYSLMDFCPHLIVTLSAQYLARVERLHMHKQNAPIPGNSNAPPSSGPFWNSFFFLSPPPSLLLFPFLSLALPRSLALPLPQLNSFDVWVRLLLSVNKGDVSYLDCRVSHYNASTVFCRLLSICCNLAPISI